MTPVRYPNRKKKCAQRKEGQSSRPIVDYTQNMEICVCVCHKILCKFYEELKQGISSLRKRLGLTVREMYA